MTATLRIALAALLMTPTLVAAQQPENRNCAARDDVIARLSDHFGEARQSIGIASQNRVIETFASEETGSWTIIVTLPNGISCLLASGQHFENLAETPRPGGSDA